MKLILLCLIFFSVACSSQSTKNTPVATQPTNGIKSPNDWLVNVKSTGRVSSNHFSDFVVDESENSYLTSFTKGKDSRDYILITKISATGEILWELGQEYLGRGTAISIDSNQNIWSIGWFSEVLHLGDKKLKAPGSSNSFLAQLDKNGNCLQLIKLLGDAMPFNCHVNRFNEILINGVFDGTLTIDDQTLNTQKGQQSFLAKFNDNGKCLWLKSINMSGQVARIRSDEEGNFYLPGSFHTSLVFQKDTIFTEESFDQDGFLIKINRNGNKQWLKQFGNKGITKNGYRTNEGAFDIAFDSNDNINLAIQLEQLDNSSQALLYKDKSISTINLLKYDKNGNLLNSKIITKCRSKSQSFTLTSTDVGNLYLAGSLSGVTEIKDSIHNFQQPQSFIIKLDPNWELAKLVLPSHGNNTVFRVAYSKNDKVFFSGHYQSNLTIVDDSISNDGRHGIFLYSRSN